MPNNIVQTELQNLMNGWVGHGGVYCSPLSPMKLSLHTSAIVLDGGRYRSHRWGRPLF